VIAELHGKLATTGSNLSERLEDQLTGDVFGTLRYLDAQIGLLPLLASSYFCADDSARAHPAFKGVKVTSMRFWPWMVEAEPDVLIELEADDGTESVILIEAKYYSGLSSDDSAFNCEPEEEATVDPSNGELLIPELSRNQLVRQMRGMKVSYPNRRRIQIFLTADSTYPRELLSRVRQTADDEGLGDIGLYWLSWHDLPAILYSLANEPQLSERERTIVSDLVRLCERKAFGRFARYERPPQILPNVPRIRVSERIPVPLRPIPIHVPDVPGFQLHLLEDSHGS
jgi:hypothetical protein